MEEEGAEAVLRLGEEADGDYGHCCLWRGEAGGEGVVVVGVIVVVDARCGGVGREVKWRCGSAEEGGAGEGL